MVQSVSAPLERGDGVIERILALARQFVLVGIQQARTRPSRASLLAGIRDLLYTALSPLGLPTDVWNAAPSAEHQRETQHRVHKQCSLHDSILLQIMATGPPDLLYPQTARSRD